MWDAVPVSARTFRKLWGRGRHNRLSLKASRLPISAKAETRGFCGFGGGGGGGPGIWDD